METNIVQPGLFVWRTERVLGHLHAIQDAGFKWIAIKINDGASPYKGELAAQVVADAASIKLPVYGWGYCYPNNIAGTIDIIASHLHAGCAHYIVDAEIEWESTPNATAKAHALMHGIAEATEHKTALHLSSFYTPNLHSAIPFSAFLSHCQSFMPQVYIPAHGSPGNATIMQRVHDSCLPLTSKTLGHLVLPTINKPELIPALRHIGVKNYNVWVADGDADDMGFLGNESLWKQQINSR